MATVSRLSTKQTVPVLFYYSNCNSMSKIKKLSGACKNDYQVLSNTTGLYLIDDNVTIIYRKGVIVVYAYT